MNRQQFDASMQRVLDFYSKPRNQEEMADHQRYMSSLFEGLSDMDPFMFDQTTKELIKTLARGQKPMPGQFWAVYHRLSVEKAVAAQSAQSDQGRRETKEECDLRAIEMASKLGRKGAEFALMLFDASSNKYCHPDAMQILIDKVSEPVSREQTVKAVEGSSAPIPQEEYEVEG